ncbi:DUF1191 domain-containing protein [Cephalotus follicularis]|uniref:DUF1191 domain-containing protein n=1 Tax=Cephalotus follicularis TaxID=3775 RepID=A0A1Q3BWS1_CEPFO|nr:DUF1191 domain-containing protein [Cephalotus follicularis]
MGSDTRWHIIYVVIFSFLLNFVHGLQSYDPESLDALLHGYTNNTLSNHPTGTLYKVSLPSNFSGMDVSVVMLRSGSFWARGTNFSVFRIPQRVIPMPYVKRLAIVYDNLGNWSSRYYQLPGYSFVAPVVGFVGYDATNVSSLGKGKLTFRIMGDPISIDYTRIMLQDYNVAFKCVTFSDDGSVEFQNMTMPNECTTTGSGHFSVVIPSPKTPKEDERLWKWWVIGVVAGFVALVLLVLLGITTYKLVRRKKLRNMETESDKGLAFDTMYIGRSKMPYASMTRTQPAIEHEYVP